MQTLFFKHNKNDTHRYAFSDILKIGEIEKSIDFQNTYFFCIKMKDKVAFNITFSSDEEIEHKSSIHEYAVITDTPEQEAIEAREKILAILKEIEEQTFCFNTKSVNSF